MIQLSKSDVEDIVQSLAVHANTHVLPCNPSCYRLALMTSINLVLEDKQEKSWNEWKAALPNQVLSKQTSVIPPLKFDPAIVECRWCHEPWDAWHEANKGRNAWWSHRELKKIKKHRTRTWRR